MVPSIIVALLALLNPLFANAALDAHDQFYNRCGMCGFYEQHRLQAICNVVTTATAGTHTQATKTIITDNTTSSSAPTPQITSDMFVSSELDLNKCVGVRDGYLDVVEEGNYLDSCYHCSVQWDPYVNMTCICQVDDIHYLKSWLSLEYVISNTNGYLTCFGGKYSSEKHICGQE